MSRLGYARTPVRRPLVLAAVVMCAVCTHAPARGQDDDVREAARRVEADWRKAGGATVTLTPRFLYDDDGATVVLPDSPPGVAGAAAGCVSVAVVGARGLSFHAKIAGASDDPLVDEPGRSSSLAGVLELARCTGAPPKSFVVASDAGRGALEIVVAWSRGPLPALKAVLPERSGGPAPAPQDPGLLPPLPSVERRADAAEQRARRDGGDVEVRAQQRAGVEGAGTAPVELEEGCHTVEVFSAEAPPGAKPAPNGRRRARLDIDAELRDDEDTLLAKDRSESPDARLELCVGEATDAEVIFAGAPPGATVIVTHASWKIPARLPELWGPVARARMAKVMRSRHMLAPLDPPIALAQGGAGATMVPIAVEPGACYFAVAAVNQGHARGLGMRAVLGPRETSDERGAADDAGLVAFCAGDRAQARLEVEARGSGIAWGLAVFRSASRVWEAPR